MDAFRNIANSRWSRRSGWLCAGLTAATGLCCFSLAPFLRGESAERRPIDDDTVGRASLNTYTFEAPHSTAVYPAHHSTSDIEANQQVKPISGTEGKPSSDNRTLRLFRWRRASRAPQDPFATDSSAKPIATTTASPTIRSAQELESESAENSRPEQAMHRSGTQRLNEIEQSSARVESEVDKREDDFDTNREPDPTERAAPDGKRVTKVRNAGPLATRRRLLEQFEKTEQVEAKRSVIETDSDAVVDPVVLKPMKPMRDLEEEVRTIQKKPVQKAALPTSKAPRQEPELAKAPATVRPKAGGQRQSETELRSLFEQPESESGGKETVRTQPNPKPAISASKSLGKQSTVIEIKQVADEAALVDANAQPVEPTSEIPLEALKLRAKRAKEQGRDAAARHLEMAADSIEQKGGSREKSSASDTTAQGGKLVTKQPSQQDGPTFEETTKPSVLPAPNLALDALNSDAQSLKSKDDTTKVDASNEVPASKTLPGRARLQTDDSAKPDFIPAQLNPAKAANRQRGVNREPLRPIAEAQSVTRSEKTSNRIQKKTAVLRQQQVTRQEVQEKPEQDVIQGVEPRIVGSLDSQPEWHPEVDPIEAAMPSLISKRPVLPAPQALANRSIQLPPPAGWSAATRFPKREVQPSEVPTWDIPQVHSTPIAIPTEGADQTDGASVPLRAPVNVNDDVVVKTPLGQLKLMNGIENTSGDVTDAHYVEKTQSPNPIPFDESELGQSINYVPQDWKRSWLTLICTVSITIVGTLAWTKKNA